MIFFYREQDAPRSLQARALSRELNEIRQRFNLPRAEREQSDVPALWKSPFEPDVLEALRQITDGRCAFCERKRSDLAVYRFRPPGYAEPTKAQEGKDSYLWLAFDWRNLFPICPTCRPSRPSYFPVRGSRAPAVFDFVSDGVQGSADEQAVLYAPGEAPSPHRAFIPGLDGRLRAGNERARQTIEHFNLNAPETVGDRRESLDWDLKTLRAALPIDNGEETFRRSAFGGVRYLLLRRIAQLIAAATGDKRSLSPGTLDACLRAYQRRSDFPAVLSAALDRAAEEDARAEAEGASGDTKSATLPRAARRSTSGPDYPRIARLSLKTYKSLEDIGFALPPELPEASRRRIEVASTAETPPVAPCLLFLGENATGKSSILEAVALACMPDDLRDALELDARRLTLDPEYMGAGDSRPMTRSRIEVRFHPEEGGLEGRLLSLDIDAAARTIVAGGHTDRRPLVFAYGAHRLFGRSARTGAIRHVDTLFHDDRQLSNPEKWLRHLARRDRDGLNEVVSALRHIIQIDGHFESIDIRRDPLDGVERCYIRIDRTNADGKPYVVPQRLDIVSSGYRAILALVCDILQGLMEATGGDARTARRTGAIVLIDEIEAHLHPRWKLHVISGLRRALPRVTFLITSHDPLCVRGMFTGEVVALNRYQAVGSGDSGIPERVEPVTELATLESLTVEQLLTSDLFRLFSTDDRAVDRGFAGIADLLAREEIEARLDDRGLTGAPLDDRERRTLQTFRAEIADALPHGSGEVGRIVQEALAEYLAERRRSDAESVGAARDKAKKAVKDFLRGVVG